MRPPSNQFECETTEINIYGRSLREVRDALIDAFGKKAAADTPLLFQSNGRLIRIRQIEDSLRTQPVDVNMLRSVIDQVARFVRKYPNKKPIRVLPPSDFAFDFLSQPSWPENAIPFLDAVVRCPIFAMDGTIIQRPGFHRQSRVFFKPSSDLRMEPVPAVPSKTDVVVAVAAIDDVFFDFPFEDAASKANAIALLLTPFCRRLITSLIPMCVVEASTPGTGKGLFVICITTVFLGAPCSASAPPREEEEWRKAITTHLMSNPIFVLFDNVAGVLHSRALEQVLTAAEWSDRALGTNELATLSNRAIWLATGNNIDVRGDLPRRLFWIRLDAKMERPDQRSPESFRHSDLLAWVVEHRSELVRSCLILIQNWIALGRPKGRQCVGVGSFQSWAETMGGILSAAGIDGFLANADVKRLSNDDEGAEGLALCKAWRHKHGKNEVGSKDLFDLVLEKDLFPYVTSSDTPQGQRQRLGHVLKKFTGRVFGPYRIVRCGADNSRRARYCLEYDEATSQEESIQDQAAFVEACHALLDSDHDTEVVDLEDGDDDSDDLDIQL